MNKNGTEGFVSVLLAIITSVFIIAIVSGLLPQDFHSQSVLDLIINNIINIVLAVFVALFAVQHYESNRHRTAFVIDLMKKIDDICKSMEEIATKLNDNISDQRCKVLIDMYCSNSRALTEYIDAINAHIPNKGNGKETKEILSKMYSEAIDLMYSLFEHIDNTESKTIDTSNGIVSFIQMDALQMVFDVHTYIPKIMASIKY